MSGENLNQETLDSRQKGDIYWRKLKRLIAAEKKKGIVNDEDRLFAKLSLSPVSDPDLPECEEGDSFTGYEFDAYPPTATSREIYEKGILNLIRNKEAIISANPEVGDALNDVLESFYLTCGINLKTGKNLTKAERTEAVMAHQGKIARYKEAAEKCGKNLVSGGNYKADYSFYKGGLGVGSIGEDNFEEFKEYIPVNYHSQIMAGEIRAEVFFGGDESDREFQGVSLTADHSGWLEVIWIAMKKDVYSKEKAADILRFLIQRASDSGAYRGVFSEVHHDEETKDHIEILKHAGMEVREAKNNIFEFELSEVSDVRVPKELNGIKCMPVSQAVAGLLFDIENMMSDDERAIPAPAEVDWDNCCKEISVICLEETGPTGLLYFVKEKDYVVLELAYSASVTALPFMIYTAYKEAWRTYGPAQKFLVPIVGRGTKQIVTKMVPAARHGGIINAMIRF